MGIDPDSMKTDEQRETEQKKRGKNERMGE